MAQLQIEYCRRCKADIYTPGDGRWFHVDSEVDRTDPHVVDAPLDPLEVADTILDGLFTAAAGQRVVGSRRVRLAAEQLRSCVGVARRRREALEAEWGAYIGDETDGHDDASRVGERIAALRGV